MDIIKLANTKPVEEFVSFISTRLKTANKSWLEIAEAFAEAQEMYGSASKSFKDLCELTRFSQSTIAKLISIVNSDRLKKYDVQLSSVQSWGTLYAIASLTEEQFEMLKANFKLDDTKTIAPFITQSDVESLKRAPKVPSLFKGYAVIQVDDEAVKGGLLTGDEFNELQELLERLERMSSYIAVKKLVNEEKEELSRLNRIEHKVQQHIRRSYLEGINAILARNIKLKDEKRYAFEVRILGKNRDELMLNLQLDAKEAFGYLGLEYDMAVFYMKAEADVNTTENARIDKFAKKVLSRPPVVKEPEYCEADAWEEFKQQFTKAKSDKRFSPVKIKEGFFKAA